MTPADDDRDLKARFAAERREEEHLAPAFADVWAAARRAADTPFPGRRLIAAAVLTAALVVVVVAYRMSGPANGAPEVDWQVASSIAMWRAPTDFLLETPGREVLETVPRLVSPIPPLANPEEGRNR